MRASIVAAPLACLVMLAFGCQGAGTKAAASPRPPAASTPPPASAPAPSASVAAAIPSPPPPGPVSSAQLTIIGKTTSRVDSTQSRGPCGAGPAGYSAALVFRLNGQQYVLSMDLPDYHGSDQYPIPPERVSLHTETGAPNPTLAAAVSGSVAVAADQRSGSIDAGLSDGSRVSGSWTC